MTTLVHLVDPFFYGGLLSMLRQTLSVKQGSEENQLEFLGTCVERRQFPEVFH